MKDKAIKDAMNSIENRIRHVYNQGYEDGLNDGKASVQIDETEAYKAGYENGLTCKEYVQIDESTAYRAGLETAWELARKLSNLGFNDTRKEIFGERYGLSIDIIKNFSVDEVADKIKEYEEKQKRPCDTCRYSGPTLKDLRHCVYCVGNNGWTPKQTEKKCSDCKHYVTDGHITFCSLSKVGGCCVNKDDWTPKKMTLDEAIKHCEEVADSKCDECGTEHRQLAEWLRELKQLKG